MLPVHHLKQECSCHKHCIVWVSNVPSDVAFAQFYLTKAKPLDLDGETMLRHLDARQLEAVRQACLVVFESSSGRSDGERPSKLPQGEGVTVHAQLSQ
jgi:hypothetical protein